MNPQLPRPNYVTEPEFRWPSWKFRLHHEDLFTSLHDRFNTRSSAIQDPYAFHRDVVECANNSATIDEFYDQLSERKTERMKEMDDAWSEISRLLAFTPSVWSCLACGGHRRDDDMESDRLTSRWQAFVRLCRSMSSDRLVIFFDEFARDERERQKVERADARRRLDELCPIRRCPSQTEANADNAKPLGPADGTMRDSSPTRRLNVTEAQSNTLESSTSQPRRDDRQANPPTPTSTLPGPSEDPQRTTKRSNSSVTGVKENECVRRNVSWASDVASMKTAETGTHQRSDTPPDTSGTRPRSSHQHGESAFINTVDEKGARQEHINSDASCAVKKRRSASSPEAGLPISRQSNHDAVATLETTGQNGDTTLQQATSKLPVPISNSVPTDNNILPSPAASSNAQDLTTCFTMPSSASPSAKRKNDEGKGSQGPPLHWGKKRRVM
ncbi:hypothetical protein ACRALDRAFT_1064344 [Sodiomyces alcalophilus JCM 7366]|uniref:uncharacterized protein n=1 Tax=Sodiomyces alcalophilus JCM 7366 TaxID=591952 RepID=UPI0039B3F5AD